MFKPHPLVYDLAEQHFGVGRSRVLFVSANAWDVAGAFSYGFRCAWLNRPDAAAEELGAEPVWVGRGLDPLAAELTGSA